MKKFLYLRINACAGIITSIVSYWYTIITGQEALQSDLLFFSTFFLLIYGLPLCHNLFVIFIYRKYFPDNEIPRLQRVMNIVLCILCTLDLLVFIGLIYSLTGYTRDKNETFNPSIMILLFAILTFTTILQVVGGIRLIKRVRKNAHLQLESSFA